MTPDAKGDLLNHLTHLQKTKRACDEQIVSTSGWLHHQGVTWTEIASALGITKQAASKRFAIAKIEERPARHLQEVDRMTTYEELEQLIVRPKLSIEQKAEWARRSMAEHGWSQGKCAEVAGVSRPAVTQWLSKTPPPADYIKPTTVRGRDGKVYPA